MEDNINYLGKWKTTLIWNQIKDHLIFLVNGRQPQFSIIWKKISILANPSFTWAWHSSAPACLYMSTAKAKLNIKINLMHSHKWPPWFISVVFVCFLSSLVTIIYEHIVTIKIVLTWNKFIKYILRFSALDDEWSRINVIWHISFVKP